MVWEVVFPVHFGKNHETSDADLRPPSRFGETAQVREREHALPTALGGDGSTTGSPRAAEPSKRELFVAMLGGIVVGFIRVANFNTATAIEGQVLALEKCDQILFGYLWGGCAISILQ